MLWRTIQFLKYLDFSVSLLCRAFCRFLMRSLKCEVIQGLSLECTLTFVMGKHSSMRVLNFPSKWLNWSSQLFNRYRLVQSVAWSDSAKSDFSFVPKRRTFFQSDLPLFCLCSGFGEYSTGLWSDFPIGGSVVGCV